MNTNLTDTQKFRLGNEIAKSCTGHDPAYGSHYQQTMKVKAVKVKSKINVRAWLFVLCLALMCAISGIGTLVYVFNVHLF